MANESGRFIGYGLAPESTRGTVVTPVTWVPQISADFQNKSKFITDESVFGVLNKNSAAEIVEQWSEGKIEGKVTDLLIGHLLKAALGSSASALHAGETTVYDNTISQSQSNTPQSYTITRKDQVTDKNYAMGMLKSLEITVMVGEYVKFSSDWVAKQGATGSDTTAYTLENIFKAKHATLKMATAVAGLAGATAIPVKSFKLTITRKIDPYYTFGSNDPSNIFNTEFDTKGEFVLLYVDSTYEVPSFANTLQSILLDLVNTDVTIGTSSHPEIKLTLPKLSLTEWKVDQNANNITEQTVGFTGLFDFVSGSELQAVVTNTRSTAY